MLLLLFGICPTKEMEVDHFSVSKQLIYICTADCLTVMCKKILTLHSDDSRITQLSLLLAVQNNILVTSHYIGLLKWMNN